jgi:hypothetical protein
VEEVWQVVTTPPLSSRARVGQDTRLWANVGYWQAGPVTDSFSKISKPTQTF